MAYPGIPVEVEALTAYYQKIGISEYRAFTAAWEDYDHLQKGEPISPAARAAIPDPVGSGLCSGVEIAGQKIERFQMMQQETAPRAHTNKGERLAASIEFIEGQGTRVINGYVVDGSGYLVGEYKNKEEEAPANLGKTQTFMPDEVYPDDEPRKPQQARYSYVRRRRSQPAEEEPEEEEK